MNSGVSSDSAVTNPSYLTGSVPAGSYVGLTVAGNVSLAGGTTVYGTLTVNSGATLNAAGNALSAGTLTNNGTLRQTLAVAGNTDVNFFNTGGYGGVIINANGLGDLGNTDVVIKGNQTTCNVGSQLIHHCFNINPATSAGRSATVTFFFTDSELNGSSCAAMEVYHWNGTEWGATPLTRDTTYGSPLLDGRDRDNNPRSIRVTGVTTFSPFGLTSGAAPTAITLRNLTATSNNTPLTALLIAFGLITLGGGAIIVRRRRN